MGASFPPAHEGPGVGGGIILLGRLPSKRGAWARRQVSDPHPRRSRSAGIRDLSRTEEPAEVRCRIARSRGGFREAVGPVPLFACHRAEVDQDLRAEFRPFAAYVEGAQMCEQIVRDLEAGLR